VLSADEKTSIQARRRRHPTLRVATARAARVEHEYERLGAWAYLAAWDVRRAKLQGSPTLGSPAQLSNHTATDSCCIDSVADRA